MMPGLGYLLVGELDLLHTLAYDGIGCLSKGAGTF